MIDQNGAATAAAEAQVLPDAETTAASPSPTEETAEASPDSAPKEEAWPKKAINAYSKAKAQAAKKAAENEYLKRELAKYQQPQAAPKKDEAPKRENFPDDDEGYIRELTKYHAKAELSEGQKASEDQRKQAEQKSVVAKREAVINENAVKAAEHFPDFDSVMQENSEELAEIAPHVRKELLDLDNGAYALYALLREGTLSSLNDMSPSQVARSLARMEDKALSMSKKPKPVTNAPAPMSANKGTAAVGKSVDSMSGKEILKWVHTS